MGGSLRVELAEGGVRSLIVLPVGCDACVRRFGNVLHEFVVQFRQYLTNICSRRFHDHVQSLGGGVIFVTGSGIVVPVCRVHLVALE